MQTTVGVFGGEAYTDGINEPLLMNDNVGDSGRPAISSLNAPPFIAVEFCREHLENDDLALVQARWAFVNKNGNLLTRLHNINLSFHFEVEQKVNGEFFNFFGFNNVWRIYALEESAGWLGSTTVEDINICILLFVLIFGVGVPL